MLSKVIAGRDAENSRAATFPFISLDAATVEARERPHEAPDGQAVEALRETILQLEGSRAIEQRRSFEAGRQQGEQQARAELQPVLERMNASINEILSMRADLRRRAEKDVVQLALLIAKRVLHRELAVDEGALTAIARVAFERLTRSESYTVTVHPRFAPAIQAALPASHAARVRIESDPQCAPGTLAIHSPEGLIDASIDAQLEEITRGLTDRLAGSLK